MLYSLEGEVFVGKIKLSGCSSSPPPGEYVQLGIGRGDDSARVFLRESEAIALGRWLCRPRARKPSDRTQRPAAFRGFVVELSPSAEDAPARASDRHAPAHTSAPMTEEGKPSRSGDHLVSSRFVMGVRERWSSEPTARLERELATFEPVLARTAERVLRGVLAEYLGTGSTEFELLSAMCYREVLILLVALRGAYGDLWDGVLLDHLPND